MFDSLREGLAAPLGGMGISFSSSLFGLAGSLVLGFLDLQSSQAQNRFYTELEDWLSTTVYDHAAEPVVAAGGAGEVRGAIERLRDAVDEAGGRQGRHRRHGQSGRGDPGPRASHAHRAADDPRLGRRQAEQQREIKRLLEIMVRENVEPVGRAMALASVAPRRNRHELLAGLRRRAVDADPRHHLPAHRVRGGAVLCSRKSPARTPRCSA